MDEERLHQRTRVKGANRLVYLLVRAVFEPFFLVYFRMKRIGREHIPGEGPVIVASNHRSFLDPFVIATMARRPMYYLTKKELFAWPVVAWMLSALGAFPVDRGAGDSESIDTAKAILARGEIVLIFPEGTRTRPGSLGEPKRGVGRLALETGVPVVPVAVIGTEAVRRGWRIRPHKVRIRAGSPLQFPQVQDASPALAAAVTQRIWPCVMLQWEWLGGLPPIRRAAIIGAGTWGTSLAVCLARAGLEVDLGCRTQEQVTALTAARTNDAYLPGVELPDAVRPMRAAELELGGHDLICLAVPARALPSVLAAHGERIPRRAGLLVLSRGLVPPLGTLPSAFAFERCAARVIAVLGGPVQPAEVVATGASVVVTSSDLGFARQLADALATARLDVSLSTDVVGVELARCAKDAAVLASGAATALSGASVAGVASGKVFGEIDALALQRGARADTFAGLAGAGDLVATLLADRSCNRRAGELLAQGLAAQEIGVLLGRVAEAIDSVPLLAAVAGGAGLRAPALDALAALVQGRMTPERWTAAISKPAVSERKRSARAA